jgi:hypothetical protein
MQMETVKLTRIGQLKDTLSNLSSGTINLVQEQDNRLITSQLEPIGRIPLGHAPIKARQTDKITLSHLRGSTLNDRDGSIIDIGHGLVNASSELINSLALADTMTTTQKNRLLATSNMGNNRTERLEINSHLDLLHCLAGFDLGTMPLSMN